MRSAANELIHLTDPSLCRARRPLLIAHRGGTISLGAPENSLAAIRGAARDGFDMVDVDVQVSADEQPVLFHDDWNETLRQVWLDGRLGPRHR
jgi:glycerophosphoryl diester phosphodiesterase